MKYIKRYNEAIGPRLTKKVYDEETGVTQSTPSIGFDPINFRKAAVVANSAHQPTKSSKLSDYADIKEHGYYNLTILKTGSANIVKDVKVTDCKISNVRYGTAKSVSISSVDDIIDLWERGGRL